MFEMLLISGLAWFILLKVLFWVAVIALVWYILTEVL